MNHELNKQRFSTRPAARPGGAPRATTQGTAPRAEPRSASGTPRGQNQLLQDQVFRDAIRTASQPVLADSGRLFARGGRSRGVVPGLFLAAVAVAVVTFGWADEVKTAVAGAMPTWPAARQAAAPQAEAHRSAEAPRSSSEAADTRATTQAAASSAAAEPATNPSATPVFERFGLRRAELVQGDALDLFVSWKPSDGIRRAGAMSAYIVSRDGAQRRTQLVDGWAVFPGDSRLPLALPAGVLPGKYELATVWTLGGQAREERTPFTLADRLAVAQPATSASAPKLTEPLTARAEADSAPAPETPMAPAEPAPTSKVVAATTVPHTTPNASPANAAVTTTPPRPRALANEQLYTGG